jgi:hypothetical protein
MTRRRLAAALTAVALLATGCSGPPAATGAREGTPAVTPMTSLTPVVAGTAAALRQRLLESGSYRLDELRRPYHPAEPVELQGAPRAVFQVDVADPSAGYVVVYSFPTPDAARDRGMVFARYLGSGFGQTNYPLDAQFAISQVGSTLVFHWWSPELAEDRERSQGAFDVISRFGLPIEVRR